MERIFLGWDKPLLHLAVDYLIDKHTIDGRLDLKSVSLVMPGQRAWNRLEEILAEGAAKMPDPSWYPPEFMTLDALPEKFYKLQKPVAGAMTQCFAWIKAVQMLREEDENLLRQFLPTIPERFESKLALGRMLAGLHYELAAEGIDFKRVAEVCRQLGTEGEIPRWQALARLQELYANDNPNSPGILDQWKLWDLQSARLFAITRQTAEEEAKIRSKLQKDGRHFYLVGLADMNNLQKQILGKYSEFITSLVFAPHDDREIQQRFDDFGCLVTKRWYDTPIEIDKAHIEIVWQPEDQADAVLDKINDLGGKYASGEIVISVQDKQVVPFVQQRLAQVQIPSHLVEGKTLRQTRPFRLLESLLKFLKMRHFRDYAEWVRHPDIEGFLFGQLHEKFEQFNVVVQLDVYYNTFFPATADDDWKLSLVPADEKTDKMLKELRECWRVLKELVGDSLVAITDEKKPLAEGLRQIDMLLKRIYSGRVEEQSRRAVERIRRIARTMREMPTDGNNAFHLAETLELLLLEVESERLMSDKDPKAVELLGWLEMPMDDAPVAIVTGMNDGVIPSLTTSDIFLPDQLRKELGLMDNRRRAARDAYSLTLLMKTREKRGDLQLIAGRRAGDGNPLLPSRFFFASKDKLIVADRFQRFFADEQPKVSYLLNNVLGPGCTETHSFAIPNLPESQWALKSINVTELGRYLPCPYRFYLEKRLYLKTVDDIASEMQAFDFGNLVHEVLNQFGGSECKDSTSNKVIREYLNHRLDVFAKERYGDSPRAAIVLQIERARARLNAFANWQAEWRQRGYRIENVEYAPECEVKLSDVPLFGRIDRIDRNERTGEIVVLDYKTGYPMPPEKTHRKNQEEWIDFQLPLYHYILRQSGYAKPEDAIRQGYVTIPQNVEQIGEQLTNWSNEEVQSGIDEAARIVEEIRKLDWRQVHPNPVPPPFSQKFDIVCQNIRE